MAFSENLSGRSILYVRDAWRGGSLDVPGGDTLFRGAAIRMRNGDTFHKCCSCFESPVQTMFQAARIPEAVAFMQLPGLLQSPTLDMAFWGRSSSSSLGRLTGVMPSAITIWSKGPRTLRVDVFRSVAVTRPSLRLSTLVPHRNRMPRDFMRRSSFSRLVCL